ncbi:hypothetical protein FA10DRAFT_267351, partial [Acaromyces ingoldii]
MTDGGQGPSSATIQAALDQLSSLDRLIDGLNDQGAPLFAHAPASSTAQQAVAGGNGNGSGSTSISGDGLLDAVPSILSPLLQLKANRSALQTAAALTRQAPLFRPRNFQAISEEILRRLGNDENPAAQAARLAQQVLKQQDAKERKEKQTRRILEGRAARKRQRLLEQQQQQQQQPLTSIEQTDGPSTGAAPDTLSFPSALLSGAEPDTAAAAAAPSEDALEAFLAAWRADLLKRDPESASKVVAQLSRFSADEASILVDIDCVGRAHVHIVLTDDMAHEGKAAWAARVESLTIRAASESHDEWATSRFPLYRKLSSIIQARAYTSRSDAPPPRGHEALTQTLFCLAALRTLHEAPPPLLVNVPAGSAEGGEVIVSALRPADAIMWPVRWAYCERRPAQPALDAATATMMMMASNAAGTEAHEEAKEAFASAEDAPESAMSELFSVAEGEDGPADSSKGQATEVEAVGEGEKSDPEKEEEPKGLWRAYHNICASG